MLSLAARPSFGTRTAVGTLLAFTPLAVLVFLLAVPAAERFAVIPNEHFYIVSAASAAALALGLLIGRISLEVRQPSIFFLAIGFLAMGGLFLTHGLATPGVILGEYTFSVVGVSSRLTLLVGSLCFGLAALSPGGRLMRLALHHQAVVLAAVIGLLGAYLGAGLMAPSLFELVPEDYAAFRHGTLAFALIAILAAGARFWQAFELTRLPAQAAMTLGSLFLAEGYLAMQFSMEFERLWASSWWEYHILLLLAFGVPVAGILAEHRRSPDLKAIVQGLFLPGALAQMERGYPEQLQQLAAHVEEHSPEIKGHTDRVARTAAALGQELGLPPHRLRLLVHGAQVHDLGKIGIPDAILQKPGRLTEEEFALVKEHPGYGREILCRIESLRPLAEVVWCHHERWDGSGYPRGLRGEEIPLEGRIVAVADVYEALTSWRPYRPAWTPEDAVAEVQRGSGVLFDPQCVDALLRALSIKTEKLAA